MSAREDAGPGPGRFPSAEGKCALCHVRLEPMREGDELPELCEKCIETRAKSRAAAREARLAPFRAGIEAFLRANEKRELNECAARIYASRVATAAIPEKQQRELIEHPLHSPIAHELRKEARLSLVMAAQFVGVAQPVSIEQRAADLLREFAPLLASIGVGS